MATKAQTAAAKRNIEKAQRASRASRSIAHLPEAVRRDLGRQGAKARARGGTAGHNLDDRTRQELYDLARERGITGRSKMGKWDLIEALRRS